MVTYYAPPPDYYYLYAWVPYPFWCYGFWFPGFFVLHDFHRVVNVHNRAVFVSNHFNDVSAHRVFRVDPVKRFNGRTFAGIGAPRTGGFVSTGVPRSDRRIFNAPPRTAPTGRMVIAPSGGSRMVNPSSWEQDGQSAFQCPYGRPGHSQRWSRDGRPDHRRGWSRHGGTEHRGGGTVGSPSGGSGGFSGGGHEGGGFSGGSRGRSPAEVLSAEAMVGRGRGRTWKMNSDERESPDQQMKYARLFRFLISGSAGSFSRSGRHCGRHEGAYKRMEPSCSGSLPHDPAIAPDGSLWYTGQRSNTLGRLDPETGQIKEYSLKDSRLRTARVSGR